jgi:hypothetical protein
MIEEDRKKWEERDQKIAQMDSTLDTAISRFDQRLMAMEARWGLESEASFRNALACILKEFHDVQVLHVDEHDDEGMVFGYPEEVELDIIIKNGVLMIGEIKSSTDKSDLYTFMKKVRFYEQKHGRKVHRKFVISPMVNKYAMPLAKKLGIEVYSFAEEVEL